MKNSETTSRSKLNSKKQASILKTTESEKNLAGHRNVQSTSIFKTLGAEPKSTKNAYIKELCKCHSSLKIHSLTHTNTRRGHKKPTWVELRWGQRPQPSQLQLRIRRQFQIKPWRQFTLEQCNSVEARFSAFLELQHIEEQPERIAAPADNNAVDREFLRQLGARICQWPRAQADNEEIRSFARSI